MAETESRPRGELAIRTLAMPADANPSGDIFGGWVLAQMDIAGGLVARERTLKCNQVTKKDAENATNFRCLGGCFA